ncbi:NAD(P)/FAD-dependent oxidoreductase [Zwartia panacis]|uniref:NAD(P)/FAD-dependent oxidoreductase n=1 Tax=Zwartia panacis TaxID=2683345 RepID=UPI0025B3BA67|nr:FAD-dependent oxidoreductase [Zwartia panacis]MDN4016345.1 NAD(P)-binding protein [Zwartia panacis]
MTKNPLPLSEIPLDMTQPRNIAIIGAGLAGLSCAQALTAQGHLVQLFEKSRGVSGRMSTRSFESWACDHGAQYFTATDPAFQRQIEVWQAAGAAALWDAQITSYDAQGWQPVKPSMGRYVGTPSMTAPAKFLAKDLTIHFSTTIDQLLREGKIWKLHSKEHGLHETRFDIVILAIPSKQAEPLVQPHSNLLFDRCRDAVMVPTWALMVYAHKRLALDFDAAFINTGMFSWIARSSSKPKRQSEEAWIAHATSDWSRAHENLTKDEAAPLLTEGFEKLTGIRPEIYQTHLWRYARLGHATHHGHIFDQSLQLGLCGDWTSTEKVEGAWLSGRAVALDIAQQSEAASR